MRDYINYKYESKQKSRLRNRKGQYQKKGLFEGWGLFLLGMIMFSVIMISQHYMSDKSSDIVTIAHAETVIIQPTNAPEVTEIPVFTEASESPKITNNNTELAKIDAPVVVVVPVKSIAEKIIETFKESPLTALAVATAESHLKADAVGYNCMYGTTSKACLVADRGNAWSVDCGIFQLNVKGLECPRELMNADYNISKAYEWKYKPTMTYKAWSAYNSGIYKQYLN